MHFPWLPLLPLLHVLALFGLVGAVFYAKKHAVAGGALILLALLCVLVTASFFVILWRSGM